MNNLKRFLLAGLIVLTGLTTACSKPAEKAAEPKAEVKQETKAEEKQEEKQEEKKDDHEEIKKEDVSLDMWKGDWNSIDAYYDDPVVKEAIEKAAKEQNISVEEFIANIDARRKTEYKGLTIDGDTITFYDGKVGEGKEIASAKFVLKEILEVQHGSKTLNWFVFETDSKDVKPLVALMQIHGEEHLAHYHTRFADSIEEIKDKDSKLYPTYIRTSTSSEDVAEELTE